MCFAQRNELDNVRVLKISRSVERAGGPIRVEVIEVDVRGLAEEAVALCTERAGDEVVAGSGLHDSGSGAVGAPGDEVLGHPFLRRMRL